MIYGHPLQCKWTFSELFYTTKWRSNNPVISSSSFWDIIFQKQIVVFFGLYSSIITIHGSSTKALRNDDQPKKNANINNSKLCSIIGEFSPPFVLCPYKLRNMFVTFSFYLFLLKTTQICRLENVLSLI